MPRMPDLDDHADAYRQSVEEVAAALGTDVHRGLAETEAQARLAQFGRNELAAAPPVPAWKTFDAFRDALPARDCGDSSSE